MQLLTLIPHLSRPRVWSRPAARDLRGRLPLPCRRPTLLIVLGLLLLLLGSLA